MRRQISDSLQSKFEADMIGPIHIATCWKRLSFEQLILVIVMLTSLLNLTRDLPAQDEIDLPDRVVINPGGRVSSRITLQGEILEYTGDVLSIRMKPGERPREFSAADVVEIQSPQIKEHDQGVQYFKAGNWDPAETELRTALKVEGRAWVRRQILTYLIRVAFVKGDLQNASLRFSVLVKSDPSTPSFALIPLIWGRTSPNSSTKAQAEIWLLDETQLPAIRLVGASLLLEDSKFAETAALVLRDLAVNRDQRVAGLAASQLWRMKLSTPREINLIELKNWEQRLQKIPENLRGGPHFLMGRAYASRREYELAAVHYLWLPIVQPDDFHLAAEATFQAADALSKIGQLNQAVRLYEEILEKYPKTIAFQTANERLAELRNQSLRQGPSE